MEKRHYYINAADSLSRCPCARCDSLPVVAETDAGEWVTFCPKCDLDHGLDGMNPLWFAGDKDEAIFIWSARQLLSKICTQSETGVEL